MPAAYRGESLVRSLRCGLYEIYHPSIAPYLDRFDEFQSQWENIDRSSFASATDVPALEQLLESVKIPAINFARLQLENTHPRDDYEELLNLILIFLGDIPPKNVRFHQPGCLSRARWMGRVIYALKIWLFRSEYRNLMQHTMSPEVIDGVLNHPQRVSLFVALVNAELWFTSLHAASAPLQNITFINALIRYHEREVASVALQIFAPHLWYLSEAACGLAFFDNR